ncbi:hypothetical protein [Shewanella sp.]|uniref:DUF6942 family protein n=1 Tax=Shewanella sp. TaxID=50422 RepID=UPI0035620074
MSCGLGDGEYLIAACIDKRPAFMHLEQLQGWQSMVDGEIAAIGHACGNGWRKVFNVYAKLLWALAKEPLIVEALRPALAPVAVFERWQDYRDACLLQAGSATALMFSVPPPKTAAAAPLHIIMGRGYGQALAQRNDAGFILEWLNESFAIDRENRVIVCPYFDYRQLSDARIETLVSVVRGLYQPRLEPLL